MEKSSIHAFLFDCRSLKHTVTENGTEMANLKRQNERLESELVAVKHEVADLKQKLVVVDALPGGHEESIPCVVNSLRSAD